MTTYARIDGGSVKIDDNTEFIGVCASGCLDVAIPSRGRGFGDLQWLSCPCCGGFLNWKLTTGPRPIINE